MIKKMLAVATTILTLVACSKEKNNNPDDKPIIKIGAILPLSGGMANLGSAAHNGAILAIEELNQNPQNKYYYELISDDTATDAKRAVPIYKKMVTLDKVSAIVSFDTQSGHVLKPLAAEDHILHISSAADSSVADGEYNYINSSDLQNGVQQLIEYFNKMGYKRVAIASSNHIAASRVIGIFEEQIKNTDLKVVAKELVNPSERQIQPEVYNLVSAKPDVVFLYGFEPTTSLFARALKTAGYNQAISSIYTLSYSNHPELFEGQYYFDYGTGSAEFQNKYRQRFKSDPNAAGVVVFDSVNIIARLHETGAATVAQALEGYEGPNGKTVLKDNGLIHIDLVFTKMQNGKPVNAQQGK